MANYRKSNYGKKGNRGKKKNYKSRNKHSGISKYSFNERVAYHDKKSDSLFVIPNKSLILYQSSTEIRKGILL